MEIILGVIQLSRIDSPVYVSNGNVHRTVNNMDMRTKIEDEGIVNIADGCLQR